MENASSHENFERALEVRDMLKMVKALKQKVVADVPLDFVVDVISYVNNGAVGAICVMTIRHGKVLGVSTQSVVDASLDESEIVESFLMQYYSRHEQPKEVLLNIKVDSNLDISSKITVPQKALKKKLVDMATINAKEYLEKVQYSQDIEYDKTIGALEKLKQKLGLKNVPNRIECFDISHISGTNQVASMVVFIAGRPAKKMYRKFKIKDMNIPNDFESLKQTLSRRLDELNKDDESFSQKPDLIVIDGGKGQLSSTYEILQKFGLEKDIDIVSLAKQFEEVFVVGQSEPIMLERGSSELRVLQSLRDEAHRFAIMFHRSLRTKNELKSPLDDIKGLGKIKKKALFSVFSSVDEIKKASVEELALVKGIDMALAIKIKNFVEKL